ncbi:MAG: hypothetical protein MZV49_04370 [Rhodopseudomonas palustris]|nr:hypothetical protein [Rhodopseudomonas palustris]
MQATRIHLALVIDEYGGTGRPRVDVRTSSSRSSATSRTSTTSDEHALGRARSPTARSSPTRAPSLRGCP